jgi:hypothetical protein
MHRQLIEKYQIDEDADLVNLEKHIIELHKRTAHLKQRIVVEIYLEETEMAPMYENPNQGK